MNQLELESALQASQLAIAALEEKVSGLQKWVDALNEMFGKQVAHQREMQESQSAHDRQMQETQILHQRHLQDREFLYKWKQRSQFLTLKEMLFESADKLGQTKEQMEDDFDRRWKMHLDECLRKLEDTHPNLAARVDERSEDDLPPL